MPDPFAFAAGLLDPEPDSDWADSVQRWRRQGRPEQLVPEGDWLVWLVLAGRGWGKTRCGAEAVKAWALHGPDRRFALVGQTFADARDVMLEGESGLLNLLPPSALRGGSLSGAYNRSLGELYFSNGAQAKVFSSEKPGSLRGPQHHQAWIDEPAKFKDAHRGDQLDTTINNLVLGLRLGEKPQAVMTGTPTNCRLVKEIAAKPSTVLTRGRTYDNLANLAPTFREQVIAQYEGTRIGRQELDGEILDDVVGALWALAQFDAVRVATHPDLASVVVAVDPSGGDDEDHDEVGIVVAGKDQDRHGFVLADRSGRYTPDAWARAAIRAYEEFSADRIVAEVNYGGAMVESTLRSAGFHGRVEKVVASRGKRQRAEPIAALYGDPTEPNTWGRSRIAHMPGLGRLEDEMAQWLPDAKNQSSPNRMDAVVWALTSLKLGTGMQGEAFLKMWKDQTAATSDATRPGRQRPAPRCEHRWRGTYCVLCGLNRVPEPELV